MNRLETTRGGRQNRRVTCPALHPRAVLRRRFDERHARVVRVAHVRLRVHPPAVVAQEALVLLAPVLVVILVIGHLVRTEHARREVHRYFSTLKTGRHREVPFSHGRRWCRLRRRQHVRILVLVEHLVEPVQYVL